MATTTATPLPPPPQSLTQQRGPGQYQSASARSVSSVSTAASTASTTSETWVGGKKRDWDNAFITKYQEFEATLQENDRWLALYWQSIAGVKDTKRPNVAITEALKASSARRRGRARMDVRDVFNVGGTTLTLSPVGSRFHTSSAWTLRRRGSQVGGEGAGTAHQGNTLNMAMAQMAMMPPRSPFLTNVSSGDQAIMSPRSQDSSLGRTFASPALARSNSAAAKTAAAVKRLQAIAAVPTTMPPPPAVPAMLLSPPLSSGEPHVPMAAQLVVPAATRFAASSASVTTLRNLILGQPQAQAAAASASSSSSSSVRAPPPPGLALGLRPRLHTLSSQSSGPSSPEASATTKPSATPSETELTTSEEDVRARLQRVRIPGEKESDASEAPEASDASDSDLEAMRRDLDEVASMMPPSSDEEEGEEETEKETKQTDNEGVLGVAIDVQPIDLRLSAEPRALDVREPRVLDVHEPRALGVHAPRALDAQAPGVAGKRKHSDDEKPAVAAVAAAGVGSRLLQPTSASLSRGRGRGKARAAPYTTTGGSGSHARHPAPPSLRSQASSSSVASGGDSDSAPRTRGAPPLPGRVAEARRRFEHPASPTVGPVAAMRPGYASIVATPAATARPAPSRIPGPAAMREAARINAAATASSASASSARRPANEPLFKSVALPLPKSGAAASIRRARPAPLHVAGSGGVSAVPVPVPIPAPAPPKNRAPPAAPPAAAEGRWGLTSVLAILSPSSWKADAAAEAPAAAASQTPTPTPGARKIASPYDVTSPQNPYQPRPEHSGSRAQLVMPAYKDVAVPLRKSSSTSRSTTHQRASTAQQRLINVAEGGRLSGVSSFRSSFFSDDEGTASSSKVGGGGGGIARTKSTPDLLAQDMTTPLRPSRQGSARAKKSAVARDSDEYTTIVAPGETYPPEIESEYSDEYSDDDEFSPGAEGGGARRKKKNDFKIPKWATTPELARGLEMQERVNPDHIFGRVKPLRINEIFNRPAENPEELRRKPRNSSMIWNTKDALSSEEELKYIRKMGYDP